jgi:hypothetical protein
MNNFNHFTIVNFKVSLKILNFCMLDNFRNDFFFWKCKHSTRHISLVEKGSTNFYLQWSCALLWLS